MKNRDIISKFVQSKGHVPKTEITTPEATAAPTRKGIGTENTPLEVEPVYPTNGPVEAG